MAAALTARRSALIVATLALAGGALTLNRHPVGVFYDDGVYAGLGWALAHGRGYVYPNLPGDPGGVHFPPLYPLVLAPLFGLLPVSAAALAGKALNVVLAAAASGLIAWHATRTDMLGPGAPAWVAPGIVAAAALAIPCLTILTSLMSEPLFGLCFAGAVILADRPRPGVLAGAAGALALLVRSIGVATGVGVLVAVVRANVEERVGLWRRIAVAAAPLVAAGAAWALWVLTHEARLDPLLGPDYGSYFAFLRAAGGVVPGGTMVELGRPLGVLTLGWAPNRIVYYLCGVPALGVGLCGLWCFARSTSVGAALITYLAILASWPVPPDRFLWAILPWLALAWVRGALELWREPRLRAPVAVLSVALLLGYGRYEARGFAHRAWDLAARRSGDDFAAVLPALDSLPRDAVIATDDDPLVWLYTGRRAVPRDVYGPPAAVYRAYLERQGVTHVLVAQGSLPDAYDSLMTPVRRWDGGQALFEVRRGDR